MKNIFITILVSYVFGTITTFNIDCTYSFYSYHDIGDQYHCETTNLPTTLGDTVTNVTGIHQSGKTNSDVTAIWITGNYNLPFVPRNITFHFPNIKAIRFYRSSINTLHGNEFDEFGEKLLVFDYWISNLTTISSRLFEKLPNLITVLLNDNMIERVGYHLFTPLNTSLLKTFDVSDNRCIGGSRIFSNQTAIKAKIQEIREKCPYDEEDLSSTTTTAITVTTTENPTCIEDNMEELVCKLKDEMIELQADLTIKDEKINELQSNIVNTRNDFGELANNHELRIKWLEEELLRLTTHPCACK